MSAILTLNAGSSSLKFALFEPGGGALARGQVDGLGATPRLRASGPPDLDPVDHPLDPSIDPAGALAAALEALDRLAPGVEIAAVGHRIVHGGVHYAEPVRLDAETLARLETLIPFAPLHQPHNLAGVAAAARLFPMALQIGCFDTAFHRNHPWVNDTFALPRRYYDKGVRRYGFHGLSYEFVSGELRRIAPHMAAGRVVIAHLGNGASMCAVRDGRSVGSTMGFSALDGLPMGTRCGQLDPGVVLYLLQQEGLSADEIVRLLYKESGLKGLSDLSHDMRTLEASVDPAARDAIAYFVFRIRRELGAMTAVLSGLDALVFCGGIGEHSSAIREKVCAPLDWLGLELDASANAVATDGPRLISGAHSRVRVYVIPTDEEQVIACAATRFL